MIKQKERFPEDGMYLRKSYLVKINLWKEGGYDRVVDTKLK